MPEHDLPFAGLEGIDDSLYGVFRAFRSAMLHYHKFAHKQFGEKGSHPGQAAALGILAADEGISQRDLAERLHVSPPTVTTMLQKLEKADLIERRPDAEDQRVTRIYLTDGGRVVLAEVQGVFAQVMMAGIGSMSLKDRLELTRLLTQMDDNIVGALWTAPRPVPQDDD